MMKRWIFILYCILSLSLFAKDFHLSPHFLEAGDITRSELQLAPQTRGNFTYGNYLFLHDQWDSFYMKGDIFGSALQWGVWQLNYYYSTVLLSGPVAENEEAASVAEFWMNGVQFEYALYTSFTLFNQRKREILLALGYGRSSFHPFPERNRYFSEVSYDKIQIMLSWREGGLPVDLWGRATLSHQDLYQFWQAKIGPYRKTLQLGIETDLHYSFTSQIGLFLFMHPKLVVYRKGDLSGEFALEGGFRLGREAAIDLFLEFYHSQDTELLLDREHRVYQVGLGIRLGL